MLTTSTFRWTSREAVGRATSLPGNGLLRCGAGGSAWSARLPSCARGCHLVIEIEIASQAKQLVLRGPVDEGWSDELEDGLWQVSLGFAVAGSLADDLKRPHLGVHLYACSGQVILADGSCLWVYEFGTYWEQPGVALLVSLEHSDVDLTRQTVALLSVDERARLILPLTLALSPDAPW